MNPHLHNAADLERIAELEAELEPFRGKASGKTCAECNDNVGLGSLLRAHALRLHARADKAEGEVERLTRYLDGRPCEKIWRDAVRVNMGGGRESGGTPRGSPYGKPAAAANPAAPPTRVASPPPDDWGPYDECPTCGQHRYREAAARKERDDG